jgi:hypothetical protein
MREIKYILNNEEFKMLVRDDLTRSEILNLIDLSIASNNYDIPKGKIETDIKLYYNEPHETTKGRIKDDWIFLP